MSDTPRTNTEPTYKTGIAQTDTPRTDALHFYYTDGINMQQHELLKLSRTIERELAEAVGQERERCAKIVEQYTGAWDDEGFALAAKIRKGE